MSWLDGVGHRLGRLLRPGAFQRELDDEMRLHQELDAQSRGDPRRFGNRTYYKEETRRMTWLGALDPVRQDLRAAWRSIVRAPGFSAVVSLTLALGVGGTAAIFSLVDKLYLRQPAGVFDAASLRRVWVEHIDAADDTKYFAESMSYPRAAAVVGAATDPSQIAVYFTDFSLRLGTRSTAPPVRAAYTSETYPLVLGLHIALGRFFGADENQHGVRSLVAVVSYDFWRERLNGDSSALGKTIQIGIDSYVVIGVLAPGFTGLDLQAVDVWLPLVSRTYPDWIKGPWWEVENFHWYHAVTRVSDPLAAKVFLGRAEQRLRSLSASEAKPDYGHQVRLARLVEPGGPGKPGYQTFISTRLAAVAGIVLLIACANVANLMLARAISRRKETGVRLALGISHRRLLRLFTLEAALFAAIAALGAVLVAAWGGALLRTLILPEVEWREPVLHWRVILFTFAAALVCGLSIGALPVIQANSGSLTHDLSSGVRAGVRRSRLRNTLIVAQAALSVLLLTGAGLFVRSLLNVRTLDIGYDTHRLVYGEVLFEEGKTPPRPVLDAKMSAVAQQIAGMPGVESVARAAITPMLGYSVSALYYRSGLKVSLGKKQAMISSVSPEFFRTAGIRITRGRGFSGTDQAGQRAEMVINAHMASLLWPGREALGECLRLDPERSSECYTVVGIAENVNALRVIEDEPAPLYYIPFGKPRFTWVGSGTLIVRAEPKVINQVSLAVERTIRDAFPTGDPSVTRMLEALEPEYRPWRTGATLFTTFGLLALLVAIVGIYSSVSYSVSQRTHEFSVRMALGARVADVLKHVVQGGVRTVALGVVGGVALTLAAGRLIVSLLYDVKPYDPVVVVAVSGILLLAAALAALVPAWRVSRLDPVRALKAD